jgi:hypothetical protein
LDFNICDYSLRAACGKTARKISSASCGAERGVSAEPSLTHDTACSTKEAPD